MQDSSWSLHHKQLYSHQNPPKQFDFVFYINLLNKPRALSHFIYTYIYIYLDFFSYMPSLHCRVWLSRESVCVWQKQKSIERSGSGALVWARTGDVQQSERMERRRMMMKMMCRVSWWRHAGQTDAHVSPPGERKEVWSQFCSFQQNCRCRVAASCRRLTEERRRPIGSSISDSYLAHLTTIK